MGLTPKPPKPAPPPNTPIEAKAPDAVDTGMANPVASLITTSAQGLKKKANTVRTSVFGG